MGARGSEQLTTRDGQRLGSAWPGGYWFVYGRSSGGRADPPTMEAAKVAAEAVVWARVAEGLVW